MFVYVVRMTEKPEVTVCAKRKMESGTTRFPSEN